MNWFQLINRATDYIEEHIRNDISSTDVAMHCNVSYHYFTKTFSMITGYSLMEYIRNRRITLASYDVSNTKERIIDIALKYGYSSNESFSRAFKKIHGINPSVARKESITVFTHFPVLHYDIPMPNIFSLRYDILVDVDYTFIGESVYILEEDYEKTQAYQIKLMNSFRTRYPSDKILYRVHHNLSYDNTRYDYLIGYDKNEFQSSGLETLQIKAKKAIRFISNNITLDVIPDIKRIIYNEWQKNKFIADGKCEIEYVVPYKNNTYNFYYIVSIK